MTSSIVDGRTRGLFSLLIQSSNWFSWPSRKHLANGTTGRLGHVTAIADLLDFRRFHTPSGPVLQNFSVTEANTKRARQCLTKQIRSHWTLDLDIDTLESKRSWATLAGLQTVISNHSQRYKKVMEECKKNCAVTATDLTFTTRLVAVFTFDLSTINIWLSQCLKTHKRTMEWWIKRSSRQQ